MATIVTIPLDCVQDVKDLFSDMRQALKKARQTGGKYYVWRYDKDQTHKIIFEIQLPTKECVKC
jgi:hypothetical protein